MTFTLEEIINSLAGVIKEQYPAYPVYASPNQQGTNYPCFFIFSMPSSSETHVGNRQMRDLGIDIVFVQQRNITDRNTQIYEVAEYLDEKLELFPYCSAEGDTAMLRTFERQWQLEDDELHYQFHIRQRISFPVNENQMWRMEENDAEIKS